MRIEDETATVQSDGSPSLFGWGFLCGGLFAAALCAALFMFAFLPVYRLKADAVKYAATQIRELRTENQNLREASRFLMSLNEPGLEMVSSGPFTIEEARSRTLAETGILMAPPPPFHPKPSPSKTK